VAQKACSTACFELVPAQLLLLGLPLLGCSMAHTMPDDAEAPEDTEGVGEYWQNPMGEPVLETVLAFGVWGTGL